MEKLKRKIINVAATLIMFIITVYSGIFERIVLAAGEKTVVTQEMLATFYQQNYNTNQKISKIMIVVLVIAILIMVGCVIGTIVRMRRSTTTHKIMSIGTLVTVIPGILLFIAVMIFMIWNVSSEPDPAKATYSLELQTVLRTEREESTDSEGSTSYSYYAYVVDDRRDNGERRMWINSNMYNSISEPGEYYFAKATEGNVSSVFFVFPASVYEPAPDVPVV